MKIEIKSATTGEQHVTPSNKPGSKTFEPFTIMSAGGVRNCASIQLLQ